MLRLVHCFKLLYDEDGSVYAKGLGVDPKRCAVFEDSLQGVKAGNAAGAFVIGVAGTLKASDIQPFSDIVVNAVADIYPDRLEETLKAR